MIWNINIQISTIIEIKIKEYSDYYYQALISFKILINFNKKQRRKHINIYNIFASYDIKKLRIITDLINEPSGHNPLAGSDCPLPGGQIYPASQS